MPGTIRGGSGHSHRPPRVDEASVGHTVADRLGTPGPTMPGTTIIPPTCEGLAGLTISPIGLAPPDLPGLLTHPHLCFFAPQQERCVSIALTLFPSANWPLLFLSDIKNLLNGKTRKTLAPARARRELFEARERWQSFRLKSSESAFADTGIPLGGSPIYFSPSRLFSEVCF